ncbi:hypothetical protein DACRYDRAFT_109072 [Dacryopinax primogenitus]|uniref:Uncharacterized protein n=1 Tax=Dacryopinax primogenitus (strain DJM 731) TaxID=1858805 RepID=M5FVK3_DACPD|nr:uncharacterized protein DACRYDRAFT_109072 [Dacryopinax primogenitus]EJU00334.1 hypothetical protein DACRYDRAFT_109072 [Dacryopinax primogenitus]
MIQTAADVKRGMNTVDAIGQRHGVANRFAEPVIAMLRRLCDGLKAERRLSEGDMQRILHERLSAYSNDHAVNPLLRIPGFNVHQSTPVKLLHTFLLGLVKSTAPPYTNAHGDIERGRLVRAQAGTSLHDSVLTVTHRQTLQGHGTLHGTVPHEYIDAWVLLGLAGAVFWKTDIAAKDEYLMDLWETLTALVYAVSRVDATKIISKPKLHIILHLAEHVERNGPALLFQTERYESSNTVFQHCSMLSNRQALSRDILTTLVHHSQVRHIVSGGWWHDAAEDKWVRAGDDVRAAVKGQVIFQRLLGMPKNSTNLPGHLPVQRPVNHVHWCQTKAGEQLPDAYPAQTRCLRYPKAIATNSDHVPIRGFVIHKQGVDQEYGRYSLPSMGPIVPSVQEADLEASQPPEPPGEYDVVEGREGMLDNLTHSRLDEHKGNSNAVRQIGITRNYKQMIRTVQADLGLAKEVIDTVTAVYLDNPRRSKSAKLDNPWAF